MAFLSIDWLGISRIIILCASSTSGRLAIAGRALIAGLNNTDSSCAEFSDLNCWKTIPEVRSWCCVEGLNLSGWADVCFDWPVA